MGLVFVFLFTITLGIVLGSLNGYIAYRKGRNLVLWSLPFGFIATLGLSWGTITKMMNGLVGLEFPSVSLFFQHFAPPYSSWLCWWGAAVWAVSFLIIVLLPKPNHVINLSIKSKCLIFSLCVLSILCGFFIYSIASRPIKLPGSTGPAMVEVSGPLTQYNVTRIFISSKEAIANKWPKVWPQKFLPHPKQLDIFIGFIGQPALSSIDITTRTRSGILHEKEAKYGQFDYNGESFVMQDIAPLSGEFEEGPYQTIVRFDGKDAALLNWSIGN